MSKIKKELELIESIIAAHSQGIDIANVEAEFMRLSSNSLSRRTLQRRLQCLVQEKRIITQGESVALLYQAANTKSATISTTLSVDAEPVIQLSDESTTIRAQVRLPIIQRTPVGYQREFLTSYQPNNSFYLPESLRSELHEMGRTSVDERPAGTYARDVLGRLLVDLAWASSKLEGNTYSRLDTRNLIELGQIAQGKDLIETQMILNHKAAIEMLIDDINDIQFDAFTFKNLHAVLSQDLMHDPQASGRLRRRPVDISGTVYLPLALPQVLEDCFMMLLNKAATISDPFEQSFFLMVHLPYLQPFEDVNKRVSRLGANIPFFKHNLCPLSFIDVPESLYIEGTMAVYELNRIELLRDVFVWAYERSCQRYLAITKTMVEPDPLKIKYRDALIEAVQTVVRELQSPTPTLINGLAQRYANPSEQSAFSSMLAEALEQLHEGSIARYRLRRSEYIAWQHQQLLC